MARRVALSSVPFIAGFSVIFVLIGAGAAALGGIVDSETREAIAGLQAAETRARAEAQRSAIQRNADALFRDASAPRGVLVENGS